MKGFHGLWTFIFRMTLPITGPWLWLYECRGFQAGFLARGLAVPGHVVRRDIWRFDLTAALIRATALVHPPDTAHTPPLKPVRCSGEALPLRFIELDGKPPGHLLTRLLIVFVRSSPTVAACTAKFSFCVTSTWLLFIFVVKPYKFSVLRSKSSLCLYL